MIALLDHPDDDIAVGAVQVLGELGTEAAIEALRGRLDDPRLGREARLRIAEDGRDPNVLEYAFEVLARSGIPEDVELGVYLIGRFARANRSRAIADRATRMLAALREAPNVPEPIRQRIESDLRGLAYRDEVEAARPDDTARAESLVGRALAAGLIGPADADAAVAALRASEWGNWSRDETWGAIVAFREAGLWVECDPESEERPYPCDDVVGAFAAASRGAFVPEAVFQLRDCGDDESFHAVHFIHRGRLYQFVAERAGHETAYMIAEAVNAALVDAGEPRRFVHLKMGGHWADPLFAHTVRLRDFVEHLGWEFLRVPEPESLQRVGSMIDPVLLRCRAELRSFPGRFGDVSALTDAELARATDDEGRTFLHRIAHDGRVDLIAALLRAGADPNARDDDGETPLHHALSQAGIRTIGPLVAGGADLEARDNQGWTPLHHAASRGRAEAVAALLDAGADLHARDHRGFTPLHVAANDGRVGCAALLLDRGAEIGARTTGAADPTPVGPANRPLWTKPFNWNLIRRLAGDRVEDGQTSLHRAAYRGHAELAKLLLDRGADVQARDRRGQTPADLATARDHRDLAERLRDRESPRRP